MKQRIITVAGLALLLVLSTVTTALALPGESFSIEPFGGTTAPGGPAEAPAITSVTSSEAAMTVTAVILIAVLVGVVMAAAGYVLGTARHRRALAH